MRCSAVRESRSIAGWGTDAVHAQTATQIIAAPERVTVWLIPFMRHLGSEPGVLERRA
jgi:hypothetical protein